MDFMGKHDRPLISRGQEKIAYRTLVSALKRQRGGVTLGDMAAKTALPFHQLRELLRRAAEEYNARLEVNESGEILYSFPRGFISRYRGLGPACGRFIERALPALGSFFAGVFKIWIVLMLLGYFVLFVVITLAFLFVVIAAASASSRKNRRSSGGFTGSHAVSRLIQGIFRFWFYSALMDPDRQGPAEDGDKRPLYRKVFSFVFGEGNPNKDWEKKEALGFIGYLRKKNGLMALPEFVILTGLDIQRAEQKILSYCVNYDGMPEATGGGTVVYRFDSLLARGEKDTPSAGENLRVSLKKPWKFSLNTPKTNGIFGFINLVNLGFSSYFLYFMLNPAAPGAFSSLFRFVYGLLSTLGPDPLLPIALGLGLVPGLFSLLFWVIPLVRLGRIKKKNAAIGIENQRRRGFSAAWDSPLELSEDLVKDPGMARRIIKEIGAYSIPDITVDHRGRTVYAFPKLAEEKRALEKYRTEIEKTRGDPGAVVFDSDL
ncbi:MAG: hypothetical protein LBO65_01690 [Spirochaetaceae bacterium]|nr:hypothetical protein [Spirochaetaceae bacterium]